MNLRREVVITPAYDKRSSDPKKNYGVHNAEIRFHLIGQEGAVQFVASTGWDLPSVHSRSKAWGTDLGYHSHKPHYKDQEIVRDDCPVIGGPCYYDGSTLNAEPVFNRMVAEGHEAVWEELERYYKQVFGE